MKVLVADDSQAVRTYLEHILVEQGYDVVTAHDGSQAWEVLEREETPLAILDWIMPGLDGVEICKRLQDKQKQSMVYAILLTSKKGDDNIVAALQAGASDYLVKPFQPAELFARLRVGERTTKLQLQLAQRQKLEAMGRLAAGIAHEINTPTQFVGDNTRFLRDAFGDLSRLLGSYEELIRGLNGAADAGIRAQIEAIVSEIDRDYLLKEIPIAIGQTLEGVERVAKIVRAMKEFAHPGAADEWMAIQMNKAIENAVTVTRSEWKEVADVVTHFDPALPMVTCVPGRMGQVLLNMIVNAAQAIAERKESSGSHEKGTITITTLPDGANSTEIRIADTGVGIPESVRAKIFDPFFTTKTVGKGTGQGLALAHSVIVENHGGTISFETELGQGTTFIIRVPNQPS